MVTVENYQNDVPVAWCPGCGNFYILDAVKKALTDLGLEPYQVFIVSGIGQAGKFPHYLNCNAFNGLHGRPLPLATAAKIANHELVVLAVGGDGDGYGEGGNHFLHAMRRNIDITYLVHNNQVYGLTKGQASPTSDWGFVTKATPQGVSARPVNPIALAIAAEATFVARGFAGDKEHLAGLIVKGIQHKGFSLIDILQPCPSWNPKNTFKWYRERVYKLDDKEYDTKDKFKAFLKAQEWGDKIPLGIIYEEERPGFETYLPAIKEKPLVKQELHVELAPLLEEFY